MKIAIIGTGRMGAGLIKTFHLYYKGSLFFAGRDLAKTQKVLDDLSLPLVAVTEEEALKADVIIHTLWFRDLLPWALRNEQALKGKILIDIANPFNDAFDDLVLPYGQSSAEELQALLPETRVAGAFKNTFWTVFDNPICQGIRSDVFLTADSDVLRRQLIDLFNPLPFRFLDAGPISNNRIIERMTLLSLYLGKKAGNYPHIAYNLWGLRHEQLN